MDQLPKHRRHHARTDGREQLGRRDVHHFHLRARGVWYNRPPSLTLIYVCWDWLSSKASLGNPVPDVTDGQKDGREQPASHATSHSHHRAQGFQHNRSPPHCSLDPAGTINMAATTLRLWCCVAMCELSSLAELLKAAVLCTSIVLCVICLPFYCRSNCIFE